MEVYPHLYTSTYDVYKELNIIKNKKIKIIIHVSKSKKFVAKDVIEEIRLPIEFNDDDFDFEHINLELYNYIHDIIEFIYTKLKENKNVLLLGFKHKQEVDVLVAAFYIKYGKVTPQLAIYYLRTKKTNIFLPECYYDKCLDYYYQHVSKQNEELNNENDDDV